MFSADAVKLVSFYKALGLPIEEEDHGDGHIHYACDLNGAHIAIYQGEPGSATPRGDSGSSQIGFQVSNVEEVYAEAMKAGAKSLIEPQERPWGLRAVFEDPDGRTIEINQAPAST